MSATVPTTHLARLKDKLYRELAQTEQSAMLHPRREARRLGGGSAAAALCAIADHAEAQWPRVQRLRGAEQASGMAAGRAVGRMFSAVRQAFVDRVIDRERSYRMTLLGLHHGMGVVRLLAATAARDGDTALRAFCDDWLPARYELTERAEAALAWFADRPAQALRAGLRDAAQPAH